jgi:signal transduction histidine kinase
VASILSAARSYIIEDLAQRIRNAPTAVAVAVPLRPSGQDAAGFLVVGSSPNLRLDQLYLNFIALLGSPITTALTNARAYEAERQRAEALAELDRAKIEFFSNVSHEFRTPLTLMLGPLDELSQDVDDSKRPLVETAKRNALRLLKLVNTLLQFSRVEAASITSRKGSQLLRDRPESVATLAAFESVGTSPPAVHFGGSKPASRPIRAIVSRLWPVSRSICRWVQPMFSRPMILLRSFMLNAFMAALFAPGTLS